MALWYIQLNYADVAKTIGIGLVVISLGLVIFQLIWLRCPFLEVPTSYHNNKYLFDKGAGFFTKMKVLIVDMLNHNYWITNVGFDGELSSLLLPAVHAQDRRHATGLRDNLRLRVAGVLRHRAVHEFGVR